jgi:hypothetical protein
MKRPFELIVLWILLAILSVNAIAGGILFMIKPGGDKLGMHTDWLANSPFTDFFIPGLLLFLLLGLFPLLSLAGMIWKIEKNPLRGLNVYSDRHWAWTYSLYSGILTVFWISIQQMMTEYFYLQPAIAVLGLLIIISAMFPRVIRYYSY